VPPLVPVAPDDSDAPPMSREGEEGIEPGQ